ncbi:MBL fold metallo-hydrolase [Virgibacillus xinjiangensis]|uniref:MBL fold metallo-hydrolase n=1 Tax=Virgibacillus xinjiangensis TaxID=393090 RepID=A0ABV7D022_9BACI
MRHTRPTIGGVTLYRHLLTSLMLLFLLAGCGEETTQDPTDSTVKTNTEDIQEEETHEQGVPEMEPSETDNEAKNESDENTKSNGKALSDLKVHFIDAGQADATLFQFQDGEEKYTILYDTGDWRGNDVVHYLSSQGVAEIDVLAISHPDADHIGQMEEIVGTYDVGEVWMTGNESTSDTFQGAMEAVLASDAGYEEPRAGDEYAVGPMEIDVLYPASITGNSNEESLSLKFTYGDMEFLFTGDAEKDGEQYMMNSGTSVEADILQLGHHGSDTSSDPSFIDAVDPEVAVYSAGEGNSYGHPSPEVVSLIQDRNSDLYGTDIHGTIVITTDGQEYRIATREDGTISPESTDDAEPSSSEDTEKAKDVAESGNGQDATDGCVNINEASKEAVQEIIHIGPERADELIELRPYQSVDGLDKINGIGPARVDDIKEEGKACA